MTQASPDLTTRATRANLDNSLFGDGDDALRCSQQLAALLSFVTLSAKDLGGPILWDSLEYLDDNFAPCLDTLEQERERLKFLHKMRCKRLLQRRIQWRRAKG